MATALVIGCNGQDGTFLCRHLLARGHAVVGLGKQDAPRHAHDGAFSYVSLDLASGASALSNLLDAQRPDLVFHVAAVHSSAGVAQYERAFEAMLAVNVASMHAVLEYLRVQAPDARALYASSAKVFGAVLPESIDEETPRVSSCLYSITKNAAGDMIRYYRAAHGCKASQLFLFNHESELRPAGFFVPKLVRALSAAARRAACAEQFATFDFYCDWGLADEYMDIAVDCLERAPAEDFVLASGRALHACQLVSQLAKALGIDATSVLDAASGPAVGQRPYVVRMHKLQQLVGRKPEQPIEELLRGWVQAAVSERTS